jgi:hypothetical protein
MPWEEVSSIFSKNKKNLVDISADNFMVGLQTVEQHWSFLKGLSHEIFGPVYWPVWMHLA